MTTETMLREAFEDLTSNPPAFHASADELLPLGRRARRRRKLRLAAVTVPGLVGLSVLGIVGASALVGGHRAGNGRSALQLASGSGTARGDATASRLTAADQAVETAVKAASPSGFSFAVRPLVSPVEGEFGIDGSTNDGQGAGRVYVVFDPKLGMLEPAPCNDPEFVAGGSCTSTVLPDGNTLVLRAENGTKYTQVLAVVIHRNGTGVTAESDNGTFPDVTSMALAEDKRDGKAQEHVTRANPPYSVAESAGSRSPPTEPRASASRSTAPAADPGAGRPQQPRNTAPSTTRS